MLKNSSGMMKQSWIVLGVVLVVLFPLMGSAASLFTTLGGQDEELGVPLPYNASTPTPGARANGASWTDSAGLFYLFGGLGMGYSCVASTLGDMWKYSSQTQQWTFVDTSAQAAVPVARQGAAYWAVGSKLYMFSGMSINADAAPDLTDMWQFDTSTNLWTQIYASNEVVLPDYSNNNGYFPGARAGSAFFVGSSNELYLYGGVDYNGDSRSDMWVFTISTTKWIFKPSSSIFANQIPGNGKPGGLVRSRAAIYNGFAAFFGGVDSSGYSKEVWHYKVSSDEWSNVGDMGTAAADINVWVSGSDIYAYGGKTGAGPIAQLVKLAGSTLFSQPEATEVGKRNSAFVWGTGYVYGGYGAGQNFFGTATAGFRSDMWLFGGGPVRLAGTSRLNQIAVQSVSGPVYGVYWPAPRSNATHWTTSTGDMYLYGGYLRIECESGFGDDVWKYSPLSGVWQRVVPLTVLNAPSTQYTPGARANAGAWVDPSGTGWIYGGEYLNAEGKIAYKGDFYSLSNGVWTFHADNVNRLRSGMATWASTTTPTGFYFYGGDRADTDESLFYSEVTNVPQFQYVQIVDNANEYPGPRSYASVWKANGRAYVFGGYHLPSGSGLMYYYDEGHNYWTPMATTSTHTKREVVIQPSPTEATMLPVENQPSPTQTSEPSEPSPFPTAASEPSAFPSNAPWPFPTDTSEPSPFPTNAPSPSPTQSSEGSVGSSDEDSGSSSGGSSSSDEDSGPSKRHSAYTWGDAAGRFVMLGGVITDDSTPADWAADDMFVFDRAENAWHEVSAVTKTLLPQTIYGSSLWQSSRIFMFGGQKGNPVTFSNKLTVLDPCQIENGGCAMNELCYASGTGINCDSNLPPVTKFTFQGTLYDNQLSFQLSIVSDTIFTTSTCGFGLDLNSSRAYTQASNLPFDFSADFSVSFKAKVVSSQFTGVFSIGPSCSSGIRVKYNSGSLSICYDAACYPTAISLSDETYITIVKQGTKIYQYIEGIGGIQITDSAATIDKSSSVVVLGSDNSCGYYPPQFMMIDQLRFYDYALSEAYTNTDGFKTCETDRTIATCGTFSFTGEIVPVGSIFQTAGATLDPCITIKDSFNVTLNGGSIICPEFGTCGPALSVTGTSSVKVVGINLSKTSVLANPTGGVVFLESKFVEAGFYITQGDSYFLDNEFFKPNAVHIYSDNMVAFNDNNINELATNIDILSAYIIVQNNVVTGTNVVLFSLEAGSGEFKNNDISSGTITLSVTTPGGQWVITDNHVSSTQLPTSAEPTVFSLGCTQEPYFINVHNNIIKDSWTPDCFGIASFMRIWNCSYVTLSDNSFLGLKPLGDYGEFCVRNPVTSGIYVLQSKVSLFSNTVDQIQAPLNIRRDYAATTNCYDDLGATAVYVYNSEVNSSLDVFSNVIASAATSCKNCAIASGFMASGVRTCVNGMPTYVTLKGVHIQNIQGGNGANLIHNSKRDAFNGRGGNAYVLFSNSAGTFSLSDSVGPNVFDNIIGGSGGAFDEDTECNGGDASVSNVDSFNTSVYSTTNFVPGEDCSQIKTIDSCGTYSSYSTYIIDADLIFESGTCLNLVSSNPITVNGVGKQIRCSTANCNWGLTISAPYATLNSVNISGAGIFSDGSSIAASNCIVSSAEFGIMATNANISITMSTFDTCGTAMKFTDVVNSVVSFTSFQSCTSGIIATYTGNFIVIHNTFANMQGGRAIGMTNGVGADSVEISNNWVYDSIFTDYLFKLVCGPFLTVSENLISNVTVSQPGSASEVKAQVAVFHFIANDLKVTGNKIHSYKVACANTVSFMVVQSSSCTSSYNIFSALQVASGVACSATPLTIGILFRGTPGTSTNDTLSDVEAPAFAPSNFDADAKYAANIALIGVSMVDSSSINFENFAATGLSVKNQGACVGCTNGTGLDAYGFYYVTSDGSNIGSTFDKLYAGNAFRLIHTSSQASASGGYAKVLVTNGNNIAVADMIATGIAGGKGTFYLATGAYLPICKGGKAVASDATISFDTFIGYEGFDCSSDEIIEITAMAWMIPNLRNINFVLAASISFSSDSTYSTAFNFTAAEQITIVGNGHTIQCNAGILPCTPLFNFENSSDISITNVNLITSGSTGVSGYSMSGSFVMKGCSVSGGTYGVEYSGGSTNINASFTNNTFNNNQAGGFTINTPSGFSNVEANYVSGSDGGNVRTLHGSIAGNVVTNFKLYGLMLDIIGTASVSSNTIRDITMSGINNFYGILFRCTTDDIPVQATDNTVMNFNGSNTYCGSVYGIVVESCKITADNNLVTNFNVHNYSQPNPACSPIMGGFRVYNTSNVSFSRSTVSNFQFSSFLYYDPLIKSQIIPVVFGKYFQRTKGGVTVTSSTFSNLKASDTLQCDTCSDTSGYSVAAIAGSNTVATITDSIITGLQAGSAGDSINAHKGVGGNVYVIFNNNSTFTASGLSASRLVAGNGGPVTTASPCVGGSVYLSNVQSSVTTTTAWSDIKNGTGCFLPPTTCLSNNCSSKANCINGTGANPFKCVCKPGFQGDGYDCTDINECDLNKCDRHVNCQNTVGGYNCSDCPFGFNGTGYDRCDSLCGNGICESQYLEDCLSCPYDCKNVSCGVCGDGVCDSAKGENCNSCHADCKLLCGYIPCAGSPMCSGHGECVLGTCVCANDYSGPVCSTFNRPLNYTANNDSTISLGASQITFKIALRAIQEQDENNKVITNINMTRTNFTSTGSANSTLLMFNTTLSNDANITITVRTYLNSTKISFANQTSYLAANTIKLNVKVSNWPFKSIRNRMVFIFDAHDPATQFDKCKAREDKDSTTGSLKSLIITVNGISMYGQFLEAAWIDGKPRVMTFSLNDDGSVSAYMPHFWKEAEMDPNYSVLLDSDTTDNCGNIKGGGGGKNAVKKTVLIAVLVSVGGVALLGVAAYLLYPKVRLAMDLKKARAHGTEVKMDDAPSYNTLQESQSVGRL